METNISRKMREINKQILKVAVIESPGVVMLGLGLYAKFAANGNAFFSILNDPSVVEFLLVVGTIIVVWGSFRVVTLSLQKKRLIEKELNQQEGSYHSR